MKNAGHRLEAERLLDQCEAIMSTLAAKQGNGRLERAEANDNLALLNVWAVRAQAHATLALGTEVAS